MRVAVALLGLWATMVSDRAGADFAGEPEARLLPTQPGPLAMDDAGERVMAGTVDGDGGEVDVMVRTGTAWSLEQTLMGVAGTGFGASVACSSDGQRVVVGAPENGGGAAHVFVREGSLWTEEAGLTAAVSSVRFGDSVDISGDGSVVVVGSFLGSVAEVWTRSGSIWSRAAELDRSVEEDGDWYGWAVAVSGDGSRVAVGAPEATTPAGESAGRVFVYARSGDTWTEEAVLVDPLGAASYRFGRDVAFDAAGEVLVAIGLRVRVSVFERSGTSWGATPAIEPLTSFATAHLDVDAAGDHVIIGMEVATGGRVWTYERRGPWELDGEFSGSLLTRPLVTDVAMAGDASRITFIGEARAQVHARVGDACTGDGECPSGHCASGVCCDAACDGDCATCLAAETGEDRDGECGAYEFAIARTMVCRPSVASCDREEVCASTSQDCPADRRHTAAHVCRPTRGGCDPSEVCDGVSLTCPDDVVRRAGEMCRPAFAACDGPEFCDGVSDDCPANEALEEGTVCRASTAACDPEESCSGRSFVCPVDENMCVMDAGTPDGGSDDAGTDAGRLDAGVDAGTPDSGPDASSGDTGTSNPDAGLDAGVDAGSDAGVAIVPDAGGADATMDALAPDGGTVEPASGCSCRSMSPRAAHAWPWALMLIAQRAGRRRENTQARARARAGRGET